MVSDRFIFTLLISIVIHFIILLGISFDVFSPPTNAPVNNLDITLVKQRDNTAPEKADFLAQANNEGGGIEETPTPDPSPDLPLPVAEEAATDPVIPTPPAPEPVKSVEPQPAPEPPAPKPEPVKVTTPPKPTPTKPAQPEPSKEVKKITQTTAERKVTQTETPSPEPKKDLKELPPPKPSARDLMMQARSEIPILQKKLADTTRALSSKPKRRRISASTKEFAAAAYMKAWEMKVERIGNLNYPQEARQKGITGSLMLSVDINPDGSVPPGGIVISRSSGSPVLDDAAKKIVRLGAPYAAIPEDVLQDNDMLTIIRTWKFETGKGLSTR
jgi:protein TonB